MAGYADKEMVIRALRLGAFDFLEKPIPAEVLHCAVVRALDSQRMEPVPKKALEEFWQNQEDLVARAAQLELVNNELIEANKKVITVLSRHMESTQSATGQRIFMHLQALVIPLLERLREDIHLQQYESQLTMVIRSIQELTTSATMDHVGHPALTLTELRVAAMVKQGLKSGDIAACLGISPDTVKTHRRNIRKKLHIVGTKKHLAPYLTSLEPHTPTSLRVSESRHRTNGKAH
jgi:FixJ family two-component response regulator